MAYFGIGALAGALGAGVGAGVNSMFIAGGSFAGGFLGTSTAGVATGFLAGGATGAAGGLSSGFILGFGNTAAQPGNNIGQMFTNGIKTGLESGLINGVTGGIVGGIAAKLQGKTFWTGKEISYETHVAQEIPSLKSAYKYACGETSAASVDQSLGGNMSPEQIRALEGLGGNPKKVGLPDVTLWEKYSNASGRVLIDPSPGRIKPEDLMTAMKQDLRVGATIRYPDGSGHSVVIQSIVTKTVTTQMGNSTSTMLYNVMDPGRGGRIISHSFNDFFRFFFTR